MLTHAQSVLNHEAHRCRNTFPPGGELYGVIRHTTHTMVLFSLPIVKNKNSKKNLAYIKNYVNSPQQTLNYTQ